MLSKMQAYYATVLILLISSEHNIVIQKCICISTLGVFV